MEDQNPAPQPASAPVPLPTTPVRGQDDPYSPEFVKVDAVEAGNAGPYSPVPDHRHNGQQVSKVHVRELRGRFEVVTTIPDDAFPPGDNIWEQVKIYVNGTDERLYTYDYKNQTWIYAPMGSAGAAGSSYLSANQGITTTFNTKITLDTNEFATGITWDGANNKFVVVTPGKYLVTGQIWWAAAMDTELAVKIYKNGAMVIEGATINGTFSGNASTAASKILDLAANDTIELYAFQLSGGNVNALGVSAGTFLSIAKVA